tara:strand:- start:2594 stop:3250 length:657 start_codon:yes stop_codon:yes gene_type:complete
MKPIIIILALVPFVLTAYAEAPSHVDVYDYPFNITLLEGGNFTLYNTNGTSNINMVSHGWFDAVAPAGGSVTVQLPADKFFADTYYVQDVMNDSISTITIEKPTPVYVPPTPSFISISNGTSDTFDPIVQPTAPPVYAETVDEPTDMTTYNDLMVIPPPIPYCDNDPEWCAELERLEQINATSNETTVVIESDSNIEVLNLRLQILKVIENIFKIVLQ